MWYEGNHAATILRLVVADEAAFHCFPAPIQNPDGIRALLEHMLEEIRAATSRFRSRLQCHPTKTWQLRAPQIVQKFLCLVRGDLQRFGKPQQQAAIDQGIADDEHEDDRQKRNGHGANDHLRLEPRAELFSAAFCPQTQDCACEEETKNEKCGGDKT